MQAMSRGDLHRLQETARDRLGGIAGQLLNLMRRRFCRHPARDRKQRQTMHQSAFQVTTIAREIAEVSRKGKKAARWKFTRRRAA